MRALMKPDHPTCSCWGLGHDQVAGTYHEWPWSRRGHGNTLSPFQYHHRTPAKLTTAKRWMDLIDPFFLPAKSSRSLIVLKPSRQLLVRPKSLELFVVSEKFLFYFFFFVNSVTIVLLFCFHNTTSCCRITCLWDQTPSFEVRFLIFTCLTLSYTNNDLVF